MSINADNIRLNTDKRLFYISDDIDNIGLRKQDKYFHYEKILELKIANQIIQKEVFNFECWNF